MTKLGLEVSSTGYQSPTASEFEVSGEKQRRLAEQHCLFLQRPGRKIAAVLRNKTEILSCPRKHRSNTWQFANDPSKPYAIALCSLFRQILLEPEHFMSARWRAA